MQTSVRIQCLKNLRVPFQDSSTKNELGSKIRMKGIADGQQVNIIILPLISPEGWRMSGGRGCGGPIEGCSCFPRCH